MPTVRPTGPQQSHNHLQVPRTGSSQVARTESLRSERSDKKVSFNKDVGVKHIPRGGQKTVGKGNSVVLVRGGTPPYRDDEWANCSQVHREPVSLSSQELEQQAEQLVKLLDHVNCDVNTRSLDRPSKNKNNKNLAHHTYNNVLFNNAKNNNNNSKNTNLLNGEGQARQRTLPPSRTTNPITRRVKGDVNRAAHHPIPNGGPLVHRHKSAEHLPDTDLEDSPLLPHRAHHPATHKSVPDLHVQYYNNREDRGHTYQPESHGYKSVENLYHDDDHNLSRAAHAAAYKSAENLADVTSHGAARRLKGFKSLGHLPTEAISDTDDDYDYDHNHHHHHHHQHHMSHNHQHKQSYKPRVGNIIKMFNQDADDVCRHNLVDSNEMEAGQRGTLEPDRYRNHNNNQPFSYTGTAPLASVQTVRRLSPPRDLGRPTPPRDSPPRDAPVYAQVNKREGRPPHNNGRRDLDNNYHNSRQEREYSAKIIITQDDHHDHRRSPFHDPYDEHSPYIDTPPKNQYQNDRRDDDDDDDAYESYQVPEDNLRRLIHDDLEEYKEHSSNNINMSSVGVQTEALPKAPTRSRTRAHKSPAPSPTRQPTHQKQPVQKQTLRQQEKQQESKQQQPSSYRQSKQQNYFTNQREQQQRGQTSIHNNLTSASLVRQVNHGFGRTDRSPSPKPRVSATRQPRRNVVPLLSDTSDSEAEYRRPTVDPLARIRDQVMQREKLQEEEEEEEEETRLRRPLGPLQESGMMTPLTIDEVDALSLVMEDTGRKSLVVSNQAQSTTVTRVSNHHHRSRHSETVTEHHHTHEPRDKDSLSRPQKPVREKNQVSREATPTRKGRETPTQKDPPTVEKNKKNNLEKERASKAAAKHKEEKEEKKKKKKKIKIKFFYDPRPQDDPNVDPLANFTEFRGTSSDERASPQGVRKNDSDDRREDPKVKRHSEEREIRDDYHPQREVRDDYHPQREVRDDYHPQREARDDYHPQREARDDYHPQREVHDDYRTQRRGLPDVLEDAAPLRERHVGSRERLDVTPKTNKRVQRDARSSRERSYDSYDYKRRDSKDSRDSHDDRSRSRDDRTSYNESADERRNHRERDYDNQENDDNEERGSPDGRPGRSLSDKYRTGPLYDPPDDPDKDDARHDDKSPHPTPQPPPEEEEKKQKIMRQRNKFLSVLMSDGRNKSSNSKASNVKPSNTKPSNTKSSNTKSSSTKSSNTKSSNTKSSTATTAATTKVKSSDPSPTSKSKKGPAPPQPSSASPPTHDTPDKAKPQAAPAKKKSPKKKRAWPWALLGLRGGGRGASKVPQGGAAPPPGSSRASSRASSRSSHRPRRPSVRASKIRRDGQSAWLTKERQQQLEQQQHREQQQQQQGREKDVSPPPPWQTSTLSRAELRARKGATPSGEGRGYSTVQRTTTRKYSAESSASSGGAPPPPSQVARTTSFKHRYFGDTDIESNHGGVSAVGDYRSLPNRSSRSTHKSAGRGRRTASGPRGMSPPVVGSAGSSLQSSESEVDSHGGSHASRASRASHVSTGSNRSVYLHATAIADIPVRRGPDDAPSERSISRQTKKVSRSFSLLAPWKPRHYREKFEVEYDNREVREARSPDPNTSKGALPPRPPRRPANDPNDKKVNRSQSVYKDSRLATWLRRRRNKEAKGI